MLHKSISTSSQVNRLSLPARLLFTWMIPHADDEGRLKGEPDYIKAMAVPMTKWSFKKVKQYLDEIKTERLIYYWEQNSEWFIEFVKWDEHQTIPKDRFKPSTLPSFNSKNGDNLETTRIQNVNNKPSQSNISESNEIKVNTSEYKEPIADKSSFNTSSLINPKSFEPNNEGEAAAFETWKQLEPNNPFALQRTYLAACHKGLPTNKFYEFASEIKQDASIKNKGAVFNKKVEQYLKDKE